MPVGLSHMGSFSLEGKRCREIGDSLRRKQNAQSPRSPRPPDQCLAGKVHRLSALACGLFCRFDNFFALTDKNGCGCSRGPCQSSRSRLPIRYLPSSGLSSLAILVSVRIRSLISQDARAEDDLAAPIDSTSSRGNVLAEEPIVHYKE